MSHSYTAMFNEEQRLIVEKALENYIASSLPDEEAQMLFEMVKDIPTIEASQPGIIHGLCF